MDGNNETENALTEGINCKMDVMESSIVGIEAEELEDITTCCICTEVYTDPKALPCIHTFCMKCIQETGLKCNKGPEDEMPCPICRRMFTIPTEGFPGLPKNFLSNLSVPSVTTRALCSLCLEENKEQEGKETPAANAFCVECKHKLCEECCNAHNKFKLTKNHKLMPIDDFESKNYVTTDQTLNVCEIHEQALLNIYCTDCKVVVCAICFIEQHKNHDGSHVSKKVDSFRREIQVNYESINDCKSQAQMKKEELMNLKKQVQQRVESLECEVEKRKDEIKRLIDKHSNRLLQCLCFHSQSSLKEIQMAADEIDAHVSYIDSYNSYCQRILTNGSVNDICRAFSDLSSRASELQRDCQPIIELGIQDFKFCFKESELEEFLEDEGINLIGEIKEEDDLKPAKKSIKMLLTEQITEIDTLRKENEELRNGRANSNVNIEKLMQELENKKASINAFQVSNDKLKQELQANTEKLVEELTRYKSEVETLKAKAREELQATKAAELRYSSNPIFVQTIKTKVLEAEEKPLRGLSILEKELFVVREGRSEVEVYDSVKLNFIRKWKLKELIDPMNIASCDRNKCLYIVDCKRFEKSTEILKIDSNGNLMKNWSTDGGWGLSVTVESNIILTVCRTSKLKEYSEDGQLIREVNLSTNAGVRSPWHAIKLNNGHFVVSHEYRSEDLHRVCLVNGEGKLIKSFGGKCGSTTGQMNEPVHMSVDRNGFVMVVDRGNSRVLLLDSDLQVRREILSKGGTHGLRYPERILHDELNGRLYVADNIPYGQVTLTNFTKLMVFKF